MPKKIIKKNKASKQVAIYQTKAGAIELRSDFQRETIWATQTEISKIFDIECSVVTKHIGNILKSKEISQKSNVQKMHIANSDKPVALYSLDVILVAESNSKEKDTMIKIIKNILNE